MSDPAHFSSWMPQGWFEGPSRSLTRSVLNVGTTWLFLVLVPVIAFRWFRGRGAVRWGVLRRVPPTQPDTSRSLRSSRLIGVTAVATAGAVFIGVVAVRLFPAMSETYPVFRGAGDSAMSLAISELLTLALILGTEVFYRGGPLFALEGRIGVFAVYALAPVYALDHIGAPLVELIASLFAAVFLGHLALRARSIWPGVLIHASCAIAVDLAVVLS